MLLLPFLNNHVDFDQGLSDDNQDLDEDETNDDDELNIDDEDETDDVDEEVDKESQDWGSKLCVLASVHFNSPGEDLAGLGGT